jgi:hypothetical protein
MYVCMYVCMYVYIYIYIYIYIYMLAGHIQTSSPSYAERIRAADMLY